VARAGGRRKATRLVAVLLVAAAGLWASSRMGWVGYTAVDALQPTRDATVLGAQWAGELGPLALALGAAGFATLAVRGALVRLVGALVVAVGAAAAVAAATVLAGTPDAGRVVRLAELPSRVTVDEVRTLVAGPLLALAGAALAVAAGLVLIVRPGGQTGLSSSYETPAARHAAALSVVAGTPNSDPGQARVPLTGRLLWDAMDAGQDPTVDTAEASGEGLAGGRADQ
jgi:uncharacterized membrane protein (TIGR02234 family)